MKSQTITSEDIQDWLTSKIAQEFNFEADEIDIQEPFARYGLNSMTAVSLSADLEDWLGIRLPATLAWDYPTIETLSEFLDKELSALISK